MARKTLKDFNYDAQAYANYLESAQCMQDDGIDVYADEKGNIYTPTEGDWTKGHGHRNDNTGSNRKPYNREPEDEDSYGRPWKNNWLKYSEGFELTQEELDLIENIDGPKLIRRK